MNRDNIDFGTMPIGRLFMRLLIPTIIGLLSGGILNLADGIFVGQGVGSDALASINIAAPMFLLCTGIALMFGSGVSIVAAVHLGQNNVKAARINVTQAFVVSTALMTIIGIVVIACAPQVATLFGASDRLVPLATDYLIAITPGLPFAVIMIVGLFVMRLDGSPTLAMIIQASASLLNIVLDYIFVFPLQMGISGAGLATSVAEAAGAVAVGIYMVRSARQLSLYNVKRSATSLMLTLRNVCYMMRLGLPTFIGEIGISIMMLVGNKAFIERMHEEGVAAFSIVCYLLPLIFIVGNSVAQALLPIASYNHGQGNMVRVRSALRLAITSGTVLGLVITLACIFFSTEVVSLFIADGEKAAFFAINGLPYFASGLIFFTVNIIMIGYLQSVQRPIVALIVMLLRSLLILVPSFIILPRYIGNDGLWLAVPVAEIVTFALMLIILPIARMLRQRTARLA